MCVICALISFHLLDNFDCEYFTHFAICYADSLERIRELVRRQRTSEFIDEPSSAVARKVASGPRLAVPTYKGMLGIV